MKILLFLCALSVLVMHFNQDLSAMYWIGFVGFIITGFSIANRLDNERANELQETITSICDEFADISAILTARSRELDRRELFDKEIETEIKNIKKNRHENK